jgi:hypothetical protein
MKNVEKHASGVMYKDSVGTSRRTVWFHWEDRLVNVVQGNNRLLL